MGGLSISQFQQQAASSKSTHPIKYGTNNGSNSSNIAGALSGMLV